MTLDSLQFLPVHVRRPVAQLAADVIALAAAAGNNRWGLTPLSDGIRVNVGWTEILTAGPEFLRLVADGELARAGQLPKIVELEEGTDPRGFYPSIPGSVLAIISYEPVPDVERAIAALQPAVEKAIQRAARRPASRGVMDGHRPEAVLALASFLGRDLPSPSDTGKAAGDVQPDESMMEGALRRVVSSAYERNPEARRACIDHYGTSCSVCGFSFEAKFGQLGRGFIHVHHLVPLSAIGSEYRIDPVADLRPVCPNCHAMLHRDDPPLTIEELQAYIQDPPM